MEESAADETTNANSIRKTGQGMRTWRDTVAVKGLFLGELFAFAESLFTGPLSIQSGPEAPRALLVHFGARGNAVDSHEEELLRLDFPEEVLDVVEDGNEHFLLGKTEVHIVNILVCAIVDDAIHVQL